MFSWGWTPFVDPDPMLSYFTCDQVASDPDNPTDYYNDANYCDPELRQALRAAEGRARPREAARRSCTRCSPAAAKWGVYFVLYTEPDTQAYVKDRFEGWVKQPAKTGPVLYSNTSPTYAQPEAGRGHGGGGDDGGGSGAIIAIAIAACSQSASAASCSEPPAHG